MKMLNYSFDILNNRWYYIDAMQINFEDYDFTDFILKDGIFCDIPATLITPNHIGAKFTQKNRIFRSSIWDKNGIALSSSFFKFTNWGENPDNFPIPASLDGCKIIDKIDGSTCIIDYVNNTLNMRTRGTFDISSTDNKSDFYYCLSKYPAIEKYLINNPDYSLLFEITTPNLKIVLEYSNEPDFWLIGAINKENYSSMSQEDLDKLSLEFKVKRPKYYQFNNIDTLLETIKNIKNAEGCCVYSNNDQQIHKIKGTEYLKLHFFKSNATLPNTIDLFLEFNYPNIEEFTNKIKEQFDWECCQMVIPFIHEICNTYDKIKILIEEIRKFVEPLKLLPRKDAALTILKEYDSLKYTSYAFSLLNNKELDKKQIEKLMYQLLGL